MQIQKFDVGAAMDQVTLPLSSSQKRHKRSRRMARREAEMLDVFRQLSDVDQERVLLIMRGIAWAAGPLFIYKIRES